MKTKPKVRVPEFSDEHFANMLRQRTKPTGKFHMKLVEYIPKVIYSNFIKVAEETEDEVAMVASLKSFQ